MTTTHKTRRETLSSRQRLLKALNHEMPDRVPIDLGGNQTGIHKFAYEALLKHLGIQDQRHHGRGSAACPAVEAVLERFHVDTRYIAAGAPAGFSRRHRAKSPGRAAVARPPRRVRRGLVDARRPSLLHGHFPPSAGRGDDRRSGRLSFPQGRRSQPVRGAPRNGPCGSGTDALRGRQRHRRRGVRNLLVPAWPGALVHGPREGSGVLRSPARSNRAVLARLVPPLPRRGGRPGRRDHDRRRFDRSDGPLVRPEIYRAIVKPRQKRLSQYIRSRTPAKIWYHTCGSCIPYIPDLLDNGVDILNPMQVGARAWTRPR